MSDAPSPTPLEATATLIGGAVDSFPPGANKKHPAFWFMNHVLNPALKAILRSPIGRGWGRQLAIVAYQGRRTTLRHELVAMYACEGDVVWIVPGQPEKKLWWKNFRSPGNVELLLAGQTKRGTAIAIEGRVDPDKVAHGLEVYLQAVPRARKSIESSGHNAQEIARRTVIVRVQLIG
jgi:hypothetical protein